MRTLECLAPATAPPAPAAEEVGVRTFARLAPYRCACGTWHATWAMQMNDVEIGPTQGRFLEGRVLVRGCNFCGRREARLSCGEVCPDGICYRFQIGNVWRVLTPTQRDVLFKKWRWPFQIYGEERAELGAGI